MPGNCLRDWILVDMGLVSEATVQSALAYKLGVPYVCLDEFDLDPQAIKFIPATTAARLGILPLMFHERHLVVALSKARDGSISVAEVYRIRLS